MNGVELQNNWALLAGLMLLALVFVYAATRMYQRSAHGQLRRTRRNLLFAVRQQEKATTKSSACEKRLHKLTAKSESTRPRIVQEAREALDDARALEKIADDKVLVAENHVRKVIVNEYSPQKHARMRKRFLPSEKHASGPFTF